MPLKKRGLTVTRHIFVLIALTMAATASGQTESENDDASKLELGMSLAFERSKGNCLACHALVGGELAGNFGPPLVMMKARFPDRNKLRTQVWDASILNPETTMPPFGRHRILTEQEIDLIVDYILSL